MSPKDKVLTFRPDDDVHEAMERYRQTVGVPFSEQIRRALRAWLEEQGTLKPANRRGGTRRPA